MSVFVGLKKLAEAAVDVVMVVPDAAADLFLQEWHDPEIESRAGRRIKRVIRRGVEGVSDVYKNSEEENLQDMRDKFE